MTSSPPSWTNSVVWTTCLSATRNSQGRPGRIEDLRPGPRREQDRGKMEQAVIRLGAEVVHQRGVTGHDGEVLVEHRVLVLGKDRPEQRRLEQGHVQLVLAVHDLGD